MQKARSRLAHIQKPFWSRSYVRTAPFGLLGLMCSGGLYFLLTTIRPVEIADLPLPNTYGPLLGLYFLTCFFLLGYLLKSTRRGMLLAMASTLILFLHLQSIFVGTVELLTILVFFTGFEVFALIRQKQQKMI
ncbi:MAG: hypothetical protein A3J60_02305 [Candidatus Pacebacteria bacterium RIFCSPHIGHO2_02_FULL_46_9]|nr:MAG: hypothetical protein A3J60_02305 [Candidatus Pacebacteria bacterium RIFCSPHIGHO2_02_FULL_46_9]